LAPCESNIFTELTFNCPVNTEGFSGNYVLFMHMTVTISIVKSLYFLNVPYPAYSKTMEQRSFMFSLPLTSKLTYTLSHVV